MPAYGRFFFSFSGSRAAALAETFSEAANRSDVWQPPTDLVEMDGGLMVLVDLGGVAPGDVELVLEGDFLVVRGVRRDFCAECRKRYLRMEISRGRFERAIPLPAPVSWPGCSARLKNGILEVSLPYGKDLSGAATVIKVTAGE